MYYENTPTLETDRLILRKFNDNDIDDMFLLYRNEDVNKFLPFFPLKIRNEVENYLYNSILPFYKKDIAYNYAISQKADNRVIGYVHINDIGNSNDIGYALPAGFPLHISMTTVTSLSEIFPLSASLLSLTTDAAGTAVLIAVNASPNTIPLFLSIIA
ncbi:GNAT family N-acetyltransferase [Lachnospiraceae bacterium MD329]|nr:GNAT family N-acetyltransferase [Lachnospiraceae bacterium MD329]